MTTDINEQLIDACYSRDSATVKKLLDQGADPDYNNGQAFILAESRNDLETLKLLVAKGKSHILNSYIIEDAFNHFNYQCAKFLIDNGAEYPHRANPVIAERYQHILTS